MEPDRGPERFVFCSERTILGCGCGERLVLIGLEEDWCSELRTVFECECGGMLTLADRIGEEEPAPGYITDAEDLSVRELLRGLRPPGA